jgi:hydroxyacylglutathione hydrolase
MALEIRQFPCLSDNYGYLIRCSETGACAAIDTPDPAVIEAEAEKAGWDLSRRCGTPTTIGTMPGAMKRFEPPDGVTITAPASEAANIGHIDTPVAHGDVVRLGNQTAQVIDVGGHTLGHIAYWFEEAGAAFVGDALFALGCGRMFEGTPQQFHASLARLKALPPQTVVYCAHEYTAANAAFALSVDPDNDALKAYADTVTAKRARGEPTVPTTIAAEREANPFLRWDDPALRARLGLEQAEDWQVFAEVRRRKDVF